MNSPQFAGVIFDFGNVLCFPPTRDQFAQCAALVDLDTDRFLAAFWRDRLGYDRGEDARIYWERLANRPLTDTQLNALLECEVSLWNRLDTRVLAWADDLRAAGLKTAILSNLPKSLGKALRRMPGLLDHFDHITFSYELRLVKPEPGIYHHALEGLNLAPRHALFLDDKLENVEGALAIGLPAQIFTTWEQFVAEDLKTYGLPPPSNSK